MPIHPSFVRISAVTAALVSVLAQQACAAAGQNATASGAPIPGTSAGFNSAAPSPAAPSPVAPSPAASGAASSPPNVTAASSPANVRAASKKSGVFSGDRQVYLLPLNSEATFAVGRSGQVGLSEAFDDRALFVLTPVGGDRYWIRTAKLRVGGEASCLGVQGKNVRAVACDAAAESQLFRFRRTGTAEGKPKYTIRTGADTYLVQDPQGTLNPGGTGVVATYIGEGTPDIDTPFLLPDRGKASMPANG